jgi:nucleotide-binding universal stress UspA family protein
MTRILLSVDGSKHAVNATRKLIAIAKEWRSPPEIIPLYVHLPVPSVGGLGSVVGKSALQRYYEEEGAEALAPSIKLLEKAGFSVKAMVKVGPIAETIVAESSKNGCDFICIGSRGMSAAANLLMGSTATKVIHLATVPLILMR